MDIFMKKSVENKKIFIKIFKFSSYSDYRLKIVKYSFQFHRNEI